ncbi:MAG: hypothetical protein ACYSWW_08225 [Planctomycetota bacterium]|jgi:hypothetical protein
MSPIVIFVLASFTVPEQIGTGPLSMLWLLPLVAVIVTVHKAVTLPTITARSFLKEVVTTGSIVVFVYTIAALALIALAWLITE